MFPTVTRQKFRASFSHYLPYAVLISSESFVCPRFVAFNHVETRSNMNVQVRRPQKVFGVRRSHFPSIETGSIHVTSGRCPNQSVRSISNSNGLGKYRQTNKVSVVKRANTSSPQNRDRSGKKRLFLDCTPYDKNLQKVPFCRTGLSAMPGIRSTA